MSRCPYQRPMKRNWYMCHPFYRRYMVRESSSLFDGLYAINLFAGLVQLVRGEEAWNGWLALQANPLMILFAVVTFGMTIYHAVTFFEMTPRVLFQPIRTRIKDSVVSKLMYVGLGLVSIVILAASVYGL